MSYRITDEDYKRIMRNTVKKLYSNRAFGKKHLLYERLHTGIPNHLIGFMRDILKQLVKEEVIIIYGKTKHGEAYQLNIKKLKEIEEIIFSDPSINT